MKHSGWIRGAALLLGMSLSVSVAVAQEGSGRTPASDSTFRRAVSLVNDGEGAAGRALLDSMVNAAQPGSQELAEALYWRGTVAPSAAEAERDYKRVILDHPRSPRVPDALLRLAQLELARGDRQNAVLRLRRLDLEYPGYAARARTSYWLARAYLDQNDLERGCAAVGEARARALENDVELRNQIEFLALRCPAAQSAAAGSQPPAQTPQETPPAQSQPAQPAPVQGAPAAAEPPRVTTAPPPPATASGGVWSVQVAAFNARPQAAALADRLRGRGYEARVDGSAAPFRVRVGRYPTRAAAATALEQMKARGMEGFVTDVGTR